MSEIHDWGEEPAKDGRDTGLTVPNSLPKAGLSHAGIRAMQGVAESGVEGGLSVDAGESGQDYPSSTEQQFDPLKLLSMDAMPVDTFFSLNFDEVYAKLHSIQSRQDDHPGKKRWMKIRGLFEEGKEKFLKEHPGATEIRFIDEKP